MNGLMSCLDVNTSTQYSAWFCLSEDHCQFFEVKMRNIWIERVSTCSVQSETAGGLEGLEVPIFRSYGEKPPWNFL